MADPDIYEAIDALGGIPFSGRVYRHVTPGTDCCSGEAARRFGGRWNPPNSFPVVYSSLTPESSAAEFRKLAQRNALRPVDLLPREFFTLEIALVSVLDLRPERSLEQVSLGFGDISSDEMTRCQFVGEAAYRLNYEGIVAASSTGVGHVMAIFPLKLRLSSRLGTVGSTTWNIPQDVP